MRRIKLMCCALAAVCALSLVGQSTGLYNWNTVAEAKTVSVGVCLADPSLRIRSGPGTGYSQIGSIYLSERCTVLAVDNGWAQIEYTDSDGHVISGYCSAEYLSITSIEIADSSESSDNDSGTSSDSGMQSGEASSENGSSSSANGSSASDDASASESTKTTQTVADTVMDDPAALIMQGGVEYDPLNYYGLALKKCAVYVGPATSSGRIYVGGVKVPLAKNKKVKVLSYVTDSDSVTWYKVKFTYNKTVIVGYVKSQYVTLQTGSDELSIPATFIKDATLRDDTIQSAEHTLVVNGRKIQVVKGRTVTILEEINVGSVKWFRVYFELSDGTEIMGYIKAKYISFNYTEHDYEADSASESSGTDSADDSDDTEKFVQTDGVIVNGPTLCYYHADYSGGYETYSSGSPIQLSNGTTVTLFQKSVVNDVTWYLVIMQVDGAYQAAWIPGQYIKISSTSTSVAMSDEEFEVYLDAQGFPESYKAALRTLHAEHPFWQFEANHVGLDWATAVKNESTVGKNLIPNTKNIAWLSMESGAYNWLTDKFVVYDGSYWVTASVDAIKYYMDPRNFLTEESIFQFELLSYQSEYQTEDGVENILKNTPMYKTSYNYTDDLGVETEITFAQTFMRAAEYSGVSPYHLASRSKQEIMTSSGTFSNSASGTFSGYEGLYNFYNIGASNSTVAGGAIANGLNYAKNGTSSTKTVTVGGVTMLMNDYMLIPWTNYYRAIVGGSAFLGVNYIQRGQNTIYLEKFNMTGTSTYSHQYQSGVEVGPAESKKIWAAYSAMDEMTIVFSIPVYENMPDEVCTAPANAKNPNNWLKSLEVSGYSLTPTFDPYADDGDQIYTLIVENSVTSVTLTGATASSKASVTGLGTFDLAVGGNAFPVIVTAENGDIRVYYIIVERES